MGDLDIAGNYPAIQAAARRFLEHFGPELTNTPEGHIQTEIAGAAAVVGVILLRAAIPGLDHLEPGAAVFSEMDELAMQMLEFMSNMVYTFDLEPDGDWAAPVAPGDQPLLTTLELTRRLEPPLYAACRQAGLPAEFYPHAAALAAIKLVATGVACDAITLETGKSLASSWFAEGCKTVPYPLPTAR